jgi:replicative DNA helicase
MSREKTNGKAPQRKPPTEMIERQPPFDLEAEVGVLGSIVLLPSIFEEVAEIIRPADFYDDANRAIFDHMGDIRGRGRPIDDTILISSLKAGGDWEAVGGAAYLGKIVNAVPNAAHATHYADIVREKAMYRSLIIAATVLLRDAYDESLESDDLLDEAERSLFNIRADRSMVRDEPVLLGTVAKEVARKMASRDRMAEVKRCDWGIITLDERIGPVMATEMAIIAARPGNSKTSFAMQVLRHSATNGKPALMISLEMGRDQIATREVGRLAEVDTREIRRGNLPNESIDAIVAAAASIGDLPLYLWAPTSATFGAIQTTIRRAVTRNKIEVCAIDYIGLIDPDRHQQRMRKDERVAEFSKGLKRIAKEVGIPLIVLQQLSRDADDAEPSLRHLRDTGQIEQDADLVIFLHHGKSGRGKKDVPPDHRNIIVGKFRDGPAGDMLTEWEGKTFTFNSLGTRALREQQAKEPDQKNLTF